MKIIALSLLIVLPTVASAQIDNQAYNRRLNQAQGISENEIIGNETNLTIITEVIYNAVPDGYHITYTTSFIGNSIEEVENRMNKKVDSLITRVAALSLSRRDVTVDIISLDPIFDFRQNDSMPPLGYKVTENITFNIRSIAVSGQLSKICLDFGIYDLINAQAYLNDAKLIYDTLDAKTVELLNQKKKLCHDVGVPLDHGRPNIVKTKEVYYPDERYLRSYLSNATLYKHHITQNSTMSLERKVDVDNYFDLNLKDADFVFNAGADYPVIQFYYRLVYTYNYVETEEQMRERIKKELTETKQKEFYILDDKGNLKKIDL